MENLEFLKQEIIAPLSKCIGLQLKKIIYSDLGSQEELTTNNDGVDIILIRPSLSLKIE